MKIAINGDVIDTKDIYKITKLYKYLNNDKYSSYYNVRFYIELFNNKKLEVGIEKDSELMNKAYSKEIYTRSYKIATKKVSKLRDSVIKIWSENQSEIPQFNI